MNLPAQLVDFLNLKYKNDAFHPIATRALNVPNTASWSGGIEVKTLNLHRAVCVLEVVGTEIQIEPIIELIRKELHSSLKARFWRGLGLGLIVFSSKLIDEDKLEKSVYSASKATTTLVQWIINVSPQSAQANVAHTFTNVSTTSMIKPILDFLEIPDGNVKIVYTKQVSPFKMKL